MNKYEDISRKIATLESDAEEMNVLRVQKRKL